MEQNLPLNKQNKRKSPLVCKKKYTLLLKFIFSIVLFTGLNANDCPAQITYKMQTKSFDYDVLNSFPQKVISMESKDSIYHITLQIYAVGVDSAIWEIIEKDHIDSDTPYPPEISPFLQPTTLIDHRLSEIKYIADTLFKDEKNTLKLIQKGLKFASSYITTFDDSLAKEIDKGTCPTLDISTILKNKKGTCSEFTNLYIALMREQGIPCRFITGYVSYPPQNISGTHAWAECYIRKFGWLPIDPQSGELAYPIQIKLFAGKDYKDCNIKLLKNIEPLSIEIIDNQYPFN